MVALGAAGGGAGPGESAPPGAYVSVEDRPVVVLLARSGQVAFRAVQRIDFHAAVLRTAVVVVAVLRRVSRRVDVPVHLDDGHYVWLDPTSPRNSQALRVLAYPS